MAPDSEETRPVMPVAVNGNGTVIKLLGLIVSVLAMRLARPVKAYLMEKDQKTGEWRQLGKGVIPAGAYVKGRAPKKLSADEMNAGETE